MTAKKAAPKKAAPKPEEVSTSPTLLQRISAIQNEVTRVAKDANVDNKYQAVTHDAVTAMLRPLMVKHGVVSAITRSNSETIDTGVKYGKRNALQLRSVFAVSYMNVDNREDYLAIEVEAWADDAGDKAPGKVISYAQKYADLKMFRITTGEDDEQRMDESKISEPNLSAEHVAELFKLADEILGDDATNTLNSMAEKIFQVDGFINILDKHFDVAMRKIEGKRAEVKGGES